ncbi:MAG: glycosyltransferase [Lachnospiraceae bacterium]|nr:glycosyltransferase [Lachnospiraceae bacterium]
MISVIIPVYNGELTLKRAIDSILRQTYEDFELIIVNDCSTDNTESVCQEAAENDSRIIVINNTSNVGQGESRNIGLRKAKGEYIYFCDSDDYAEDKILEVLLDKMMSADVDITCCDYWQYNWRADIRQYEKILICSECIDDDEILTIDKRPDMPDFFPCIMWNKLYKKEVFQEIEFPREKLFFEDFYVNCMAMLKKYRFLYSHHVLYHYFASNENSSNSNANVKKMTDDLKIIFKQLDEHFRTSENYESIACAFMNHARRSLKYHLSKTDNTDRLLNEQAINRSIEEYFGQTYTIYNTDTNIYAFGSFNVRRVLQLLPYKAQHISYSKIDSMIKDTSMLEEVKVIGRNPFRTRLLDIDINHNIVDIWGAEKKDEYLILDLLDERMKTIVFNNRVITENEFFDEYSYRNCVHYEEIESGPEEWKESVHKFAECLRTMFDEKKIILIKNRMSRGYGFFKQECTFNEIDIIDSTNEMIAEKEQFLLEELKDIQVIEIPEKLNYTYCRHSFGTRPFYHNYRWYYYVAEEIRKRIN